jgi:hypothetical protein
LYNSTARRNKGEIGYVGLTVGATNVENLCFQKVPTKLAAWNLAGI